MISLIRELDASQLRQLIKLLDPRADLDELAEPELLGELVRVLRSALEVPEKDDLPDFLRRRLVEVASRQFGLCDRPDLTTDLELAELLADYVLEAAAELGRDNDQRQEFEVFLRTKSRRERLDWLVASRRAAALVGSEGFDRNAARAHAEEIQEESGSAHRATAAAILDDLGSLTKRPSRSGPPSKSSTVMTAAAAGATAGSLAMPLAAVAGGLFMSGRSKRGAAEVAESEAKRSRANRARRSRMVQSVVILSVYLVASQTNA